MADETKRSDTELEAELVAMTDETEAAPGTETLDVQEQLKQLGEQLKAKEAEAK
jgi:hypothetical protein